MTEQPIKRPIRKESQREDINLYEILFKYLAYWPWFIIGVVVCMCSAYIYLRYSEPVYSTNAKILIKEQDGYRSKASTPMADVMELATINLASLFDNEMEILKTKTLIKKAVTDLELYINHSLKRKFGYNIQLYKNSPIQVYMTPEEANKLRGRVEIKMSYDGKELMTYVSYPNQIGEVVTLENKFSELPAALPTEVGVITFTPAANYVPENTIELLASISNPQATAASYRANMGVTPTSKTTTIANITVNNAIPARAADFINQLIKVYNEDANDEKNEVAQKTAEFIDERIAIINSELSSTENELATFKQRTGLTNLTSDAQEKMAHIYIMKGNKQTEVDELACGDIGMVAKLSDTNTNDTLAAGGKAYAATKYPNPYMCQAMMPATAKDESKISQAIARMTEEDLTLKYENNPETKQMLIYGLGDMHLSVLAAKMKGKFGVQIKLDTPKIAYREKITKKCDVEGKHKKQNGGSGQYGHVKIRFAPGEEEGLTFIDATVGGSVPKNFIPAVEKGLQDAMAKGVAGYPMVNLKAELYDGSYHAVDSDELSFRTAANLAYKKCLEMSAPVLLEPVGSLFITVPDGMVGDVMSDIPKRRGNVMGMNPAEGKPGYTVVEAVAPKSELVSYPIDLRAMSQGRASFEFEVTGYDVVPANIAQKVIEEAKKAE